MEREEGRGPWGKAIPWELPDHVKAWAVMENKKGPSRWDLHLHSPPTPIPPEDGSPTFVPGTAHRDWVAVGDTQPEGRLLGTAFLQLQLLTLALQRGPIHRGLCDQNHRRQQEPHLRATAQGPLLLWGKHVKDEQVLAGWVSAASPLCDHSMNGGWCGDHFSIYFPSCSQGMQQSAAERALSLSSNPSCTNGRYVTLGKEPKLPKPQHPHLYKGANVPLSAPYDKGKY